MSEWDGTAWEGEGWDGRAVVAQKAATGTGVGFFSTAYPLSSQERTPQALMKRAQLAFHQNPWIGTAETVVTRKVVGLSWHLEDGNDEEYRQNPAEGEGIPETPEVASVRMLMERPQLNVGNLQPGTATRRLMMGLTSRHLGLCGMSYWYGDQMDARGVPLAWLYINPARMWPAEDRDGNLTGWVLDPVDDAGHGGTPLSLSEVLPFYLDPPDRGNLGSGLYARTILKAQLTNLADQHAAYVLGTGGRIAGIVSPKDGTIPDEKFADLVREFRKVNDAPDAAKRTTILQGPIDFTPTAADPAALTLVEMAKMNRDDVFTVWGVPGSQAPVPVHAGLNSGTTKGFDEAILMQGAVHDRVQAIAETLQFGWLDKYLPTVIDLEVEEPQFDDKAPSFALLTASREAPLTNAQRLAIIGEPPTGDPNIDNAILLPSTIVLWATTPIAGATEGVIEGPAPVPAPFAPPAVDTGMVDTGTMPAKAGFLGLRKSVDTRIVPAVRRSVQTALAAQRAHIAQRIRDKGAHLAKNPTDARIWWNPESEDKRLAAVLLPHMAGIAESVTKRAAEVLDRPAKADAFEQRVDAFVRKRTTERIGQMNQTTRDQVQDAVLAGFEQGLSPLEVALLIEGLTTFDDLRAERIARSETMYAYNDAALNSYTEFGVSMVEPLDGDQDEMCAERLARGPVSIDEALDDLDHPNGTLDWAPYFGKAQETVERVRPAEADVARVAPAAFDVAELVRAFTATRPEPVSVNVSNADTRLVRHVIERDEYTGKVIATREEYVDAP